MHVQIFENYQALSQHAAAFILDLIRRNPNAVLCLPSGESPVGTFQYLTAAIRENDVDLSQVTFIGLDEWVGIPAQNSGSCSFFLNKWVFAPLQVKPERIHLFNGMADDLNAECQMMDEFIGRSGGLDFMLVGVGVNGHIGLNEPGVSPELYCHVMDLALTTREVGQKYFRESTNLTKGITVGLKHMAEAKTVMLIANGERKANIIRDTLEKPVSPEIPSTFLRNHNNSFLFLDEHAASLVKQA